MSKTRGGKQPQKNVSEKVKRLYKRYDRYKVELMTESATVVPTDTLGGLQDRLLKLEGVIPVTKCDWLILKQRRLYRQHTWRMGKTTKAFFKRISCKFGDNIVPYLNPAEGHPVHTANDKANILADDWSPILNGPPASASAQHVADWMASGPTDDLQSLEPANLFTLETVTSALKACKRGKLVGLAGSVTIGTSLCGPAHSAVTADFRYVVQR